VGLSSTGLVAEMQLGGMNARRNPVERESPVIERDDRVALGYRSGDAGCSLGGSIAIGSVASGELNYEAPQKVEGNPTHKAANQR
jgi:hypothetical protein